MLIDKGLPGLGDERQRGGVDIVQHDVAAFQHLALQDISDRAVTELGAARAYQNNAFFHKSLLSDRLVICWVNDITQAIDWKWVFIQSCRPSGRENTFSFILMVTSNQLKTVHLPTQLCALPMILYGDGGILSVRK